MMSKRKTLRTARNKSSGFTLVELMIVISIQAILVAVVAMVINPVSIMKKGRDSRRLADSETIRNTVLLALTEEEITLNKACATNPCSSAGGDTSVDGENGFVKFDIPDGKVGLSKYIPTLPLDPINRDSNVYTFSSEGTYFEINIVFESEDNASRMQDDGGNDPDVYELGTKLDLI